MQNSSSILYFSPLELCEIAPIELLIPIIYLNSRPFRFCNYYSMDKLKDVAMLLKAKITKDETEELLIQATSEENWQTPTPILHDICNVAYNYEEWQKISAFIWEKLKLKKWRKVLKTLNMVDFLLKNGPSSILSSFKHEVYVFRSLDNFNCLDEGVDRGEAIRQRAKSIVELLTNEELLEEQRTKAKAIKQRMGESAGSGSTYKGVGSKSFGSGTSKYEGYDSKKGKSNIGSYGSSLNEYESGYGGGNVSSNLNKYKKELGGDSVYKKTTEEKKHDQKKKKEEAEAPKHQKQQLEQDSKNKPKPFDQQGRNLVKPGQAPLLSKPDANKNPSQKASNPSPSTQAQQGSGFNFFQEQQLAPASTTTNKPQAPVANNPPATDTINLQAEANKQAGTSLPFGAFQFPQQNPQNIQQNTNNLQGLNLFPKQNPAPMQNQQGLGFNQQQNLNQQGINFNIGQGFNQPQQAFNINPQQSFGGLGNITMNPKPTGTSNQMFTLNPTTTNKDDEFGGFDQGHQEIKWMSADESNLTNLTDLSKEVNQKNLSNNKKKAGAQSNILATSEDFDFLSTPSTNSNLGMNFGVSSPHNQMSNIMIGGYPVQNQSMGSVNWHPNQYQNQQQKQPNVGGISFF